MIWAGYTVPAGWLFFGIPLIHFDEEKYDDPLKFNPWRWKVIAGLLKEYSTHTHTHTQHIKNDKSTKICFRGKIYMVRYPRITYHLEQARHFA